MKICPYCAAENRPDAQVCYNCGRSLGYEPPSLFGDPPASEPFDPNPTQPRRVRPASPGDTQPGGAYPPPPGGPPRPAWENEPPRQRAPNEWETQARPAAPSNPHGQQQSQHAYNQPVYTPPPPPPVAPLFPPGSIPQPKRDHTRVWRIVAGVLVVVLLCTGLFAVYTVFTSVTNGVRRAGDRLATQAAGVVPVLPGSQPSETPAPGEVFVTPTPWPTFTQLSQVEAEPPASTPQPGPDLTRYLTPECASALDHLRSANQKFTDNPAAPFDRAWREDLSSAVNQMKAYCGTLESASPVPNQVEEAHETLKMATESFDTAGQLLKEGAEELNPGKFLDAGGKLFEAGRYLTEALKMLDQIGE